MRSTYRVLSLFMFLCGLWIFSGCKGSQEKENAEIAIEEQRVTEVKIAEAKTGQIVSHISTTGTVFAIKETRIRPKVSGRIEKILVSEGDKVKADQELVRLEQQDFLLAKHRAEAALGIANAALQQLLAGVRGEDIQSAKAALLQAEASLEEAKSEYERVKRLYETKVVSNQMFDAAKARYRITEEGVRIASENLKKVTTGPTEEDIQVARARVQEAKVGLEMAKQQLKDSIILAPFDGIIAEKFMNEGEIVSSMSPEVLLRIIDIDTVKIECAIPESELSRVQVRAKANIEVDAYSASLFPGDITIISPVIDQLSHTFKVTIAIPNSEHRLKPGMFARVQIITETHENTVLIPRSAVTSRASKEIAFVVESDTAVLREVLTGLRDDQFIEILQGIQAGEQVIIEGNYGLENRTKIRMQ